MEDGNLLDDVFEDDSPDSPPIEYAGFWIRVGASLIDTLVFIPLIAFEFYNKTTLHSLPLLIVTTLLMLVYKPYLEFSRGATIGKSVLNIKVVNEDFGWLTFNQAILRFMPWFISSFIAFMISLEFYTGELTADSFMEIGLASQGTFWSNLNGLYSLVFMVIVIVVAFDSRKQGLHDKIAETYCIITRG